MDKTKNPVLDLVKVEKALSELTESGSYTRDELRMEMAIDYRCPATIVDKLLKKLGVSFGKTGTYGYRHWSCEAFLENPELPREEWETGIAKHLDDIKNYKQHYDCYYALVNKQLMK